MYNKSFRLIILFISIFLIGFVNAAEPLPERGLSDTFYLKEQLGTDLDSKPNLFTGEFVQSYKMMVPSGTKGLSPSIAVTYSSHRIYDSTPSILGRGWDISENSIERDTNYSMYNVSDDQFILNLNGNAYKLSYSSVDQRYHTSVENFLYITNSSAGNNTNNVYWTIITKDGTRYRFGYNNDSEEVANLYRYTYKWNLDLVKDVYDNNIFYSYKKNNTNNFGVTLLDSIEYNNDRTRRVKFIYEESNMPDTAYFVTDGNLIRLSKRLRAVNITVDDSVVRVYELNYFKNTSSSLLANITEYGSDSISKLPSNKFNYYPEGTGLKNATGWSFPPNQSFQWGHINGGIPQGLRVGDLNRDGLTDLVISQCSYSHDTGNCTSISVERKVFINNRTGWYENNNWTLPETAPFADVPIYEPTGTQLEDINGDGFTDILQMYANPNSYPPHDIRVQRLWLNNGTAFVDSSSNWTFPQNEWFYSTNVTQETGLRLIDLNGDGLLDLAKSRCLYTSTEYCYINFYNWTFEQKVWINNGTGWTNKTNWKLPSGIAFITGDGVEQQDTGVRFADVNGDLLTDIIAMYGFTPVFPGTPTLVQQLWINNGSGFINQTGNWTFPYKEYFTVGGDSIENGVQIMDINGDGRADIVKSACTGVSIYDCHITPGANKQDVWINNGEGWFNGTNWRIPSSIPFIEYGTPGYVNPHDMGTRFADLNGDGSIDILRMYKSNTGSPQNYQLREAWLNNGSMFLLMKNSTNQFGGSILTDYQPSTMLSNIGDDNKSDMGFNLMVLSNITEDNGLSTSQRTQVIRKFNYSNGLYEYASKEFRGFANVEERLDNKKIVHSFLQDESRQGREYKLQIFDNQSNIYLSKELNWNSTNLYGYFIVNLIEESEKTHDGVTSNPKIRNMTYNYDSFGNIFVTHDLGDVDNANDDKYEKKIYATNSTNWIVNKISNYTILGSDDLIVLKTSLYTYDDLPFGSAPAKGSITKKEDFISNNLIKATNYSYNSFGNLVNETDSNGNKLTYIHGLRDATNTFIDRILNAKNHQSDYYYEKGTGNVLSEIDSNGIATNYTYDQFGRKTKEIRPYDSLNYPSIEVNYSLDGVAPEVIFIKLRSVVGASDTLETYEIIDGFGKPIQVKRETLLGQQIITNTFYDLSGKIAAQSNPYYSVSSAEYSSPNASIALTNYTYDSLDRLVKIINPDKTFKKMNYTHWNLTIYDENGNRKDNLLDAYKRISFVVEYLNGSNYITSYNYDAVNDLLSIKDSFNNTFNYTYDLTGKKTKENDPDRGSWNYTYDNEGNLIRRTDNRNVFTVYSYDSLNRKVNETNNVTTLRYSYDNYLNLTLSGVDANGTLINYSYDNRLRKIKEDRNIFGKFYSENWSHDSSDRVILQIMPDGRLINFTYDEQGLLSGISTISNISYNEKNNPVMINYANGLLTNYSYNSSNLRLLEIKTSNKQDLDYQYDAVGNVMSIQDGIHNINYSMSYDPLNRLTSTNIMGPFIVGFNFIYDQLGNLRNVTGDYATDYYYQDTRPHATSRVVFY
ncbi:VCBS repeat-containing protein [Candidatus Pacearchaeota archaeon]|nr:VCBS repeat-containing protein [Candidatus Pacearchaeota archaeon]